MLKTFIENLKDTEEVQRFDNITIYKSRGSDWSDKKKYFTLTIYKSDWGAKRIKRATLKGIQNFCIKNLSY